jgi:uncharacterized protein
MILAVDVNVLVAAFREDHPHHSAVHPWWLRVVSEPVDILASDVVLTGFVRIVTNSKIFPTPSTPDEAFAFVDALLAHPRFVQLGAADGVIDEFRAICVREGVTGNLVPDAYIVACATAVGGVVASLDRDFRRFDDLRLVVPGEDSPPRR